MVRRLISTAMLVVCAGAYALAASERVTFVLTNGERRSGTVAFHGDQHENLINNYLNIATNDKDETFPVDQVAVIDFAGGQPQAAELSQLGAGQMLVMKDGSAQQGRFVNMIGGDTLLWDNQSGQRQQFALRDVSRIYLNPGSARTVFNAPAGNTAVATSGQTGGQQVRVDAKQAWTDTGITVNAGDRVVFNASGQIAYGQSAGQTSDPNGNAAERRANYPDPTVPVGALIGKVGNSKPFAIGMQTQPLGMPASGRLMLGINDNELGDNSGFYTVTVTKQ
ncbi:MAG TPA: LecA/PA-IL family lectin [Ilumatobacteraceae bacterium]